MLATGQGNKGGKMLVFDAEDGSLLMSPRHTNAVELSIAHSFLHITPAASLRTTASEAGEYRWDWGAFLSDDESGDYERVFERFTIESAQLWPSRSVLRRQLCSLVAPSPC